jgi:hypothetical protein
MNQEFHFSIWENKTLKGVAKYCHEFTKNIYLDLEIPIFSPDSVEKQIGTLSVEFRFQNSSLAPSTNSKVEFFNLFFIGMDNNSIDHFK